MPVQAFTLKRRTSNDPPTPSTPCLRGAVRFRHHHWLLEDPKDGKIQGVCKNCRKRREYAAFLPGSDYLLGPAVDPLPPRTLIGHTSGDMLDN